MGAFAVRGVDGRRNVGLGIAVKWMIKVDLEGESLPSPEPVGVLPENAQFLRRRQLLQLRGQDFGHGGVLGLGPFLRHLVHIGEGETVFLVGPEGQYQEKRRDESESEMK